VTLPTATLPTRLLPVAAMDRSAATTLARPSPLNSLALLRSSSRR
jgi:hypothetical protein